MCVLVRILIFKSRYVLLTCIISDICNCTYVNLLRINDLESIFEIDIWRLVEGEAD